MLDALTDRLTRTLRNISNRGRLTEDNIKDTLRKVRLALLEADVAFPVVQEFMQSVKESALGRNINKNFTPGQAFIKIMHNELTKAIGEGESSLNLSVQPPAVILLTGLQGSGKTTTAAKLGKFLKDIKKKKVLAVSTDIYRPAAIKQLEVLTRIGKIDFFPSTSSNNPVNIATLALQYAKLKFYDVLIIDTAGRLHVDETMMKEIQVIHHSILPVETLFIVDAMTGQDAANTAQSFNKQLPLTGIILTKIDSDTRGGAALSIYHMTGKPIKFLGTGESIDGLELFYPNRIASRILGMKDVFSLIEKIESTVNRDQAQKLANKLKKNNHFDLNDFLEQLKQMGSMGTILSKIPGISQIPDEIQSQIDHQTLKKMKAIIGSMSKKERQKPEIIKGSQKRRIAAGSGTQVQDVNQLLKKFDDIQRMIKTIQKCGVGKIMRGIKGLIMPPGFSRK